MMKRDIMRISFSHLTITTLPQLRGYSICILFAILISLLSSCAVNPVTGSPELMIYSDEQEVSMGQKAHPQVVQEYGYYNDRQIQDYVSAVGRRVSSHCERQSLNYHFTVIDAPILNAFALPGGYVYVSRGLLAECNNEAQLAAVIGHELGHVNGRHNMKRLQAALGMNIFSVAVGAATGSSAWQQVSGTLFGLIGQKYSRSQEREADDLGTRYTAMAGYDPGQMSSFLGRLRELHSQEPAGLEAIMASHPLTSERVTRTAFLASQLQKQYPRAIEINRQSYLQAIDGLQTGPDVRAGFVLGNTYTNSFCRIRFTIPAEMTLKPLKNGFIMTDSGKQELVFIYQEMERYLPPAVMADGFMEKYATRLQAEEGITINQSAGITRDYQVKNKQGTWQQIKLAAFTGQDFGYLFLAFTPHASKPAFLQQHLAMLSRQQAEKVNIPRLQIYTVRQGDTLATIADHFFQSPAEAKNIAGYNGLGEEYPAHKSLPTGMQLKIIPAYGRDT
ncbi:MAG: M48 family metalloprotease [Deltaproteobacteria bacterium]|nr:M48 family metalloprotease [Candidatus Anaeroferrophillus wilburensis]MBN2888325.1 M48 family metalloprotease [Deltaproteobacteria bacterium]